MTLITYNILNLHNSHILEVLYLLAPFYSWGNKTQNGQNSAAETHSMCEGARIWTYIDSGIYRPKHHTALLLHGAKEKISVHQDQYPNLQTFTNVNKLGAEWYLVHAVRVEAWVFHRMIKSSGLAPSVFSESWNVTKEPVQMLLFAFH